MTLAFQITTDIPLEAKQPGDQVIADGGLPAACPEFCRQQFHQRVSRAVSTCGTECPDRLGVTVFLPNDQLKIEKQALGPPVIQ